MAIFLFPAWRERVIKRGGDAPVKGERGATLSLSSPHGERKIKSSRDAPVEGERGAALSPVSCIEIEGEKKSSQESGVDRSRRASTRWTTTHHWTITAVHVVKK